MKTAPHPGYRCVNTALLHVRAPRRRAERGQPGGELLLGFRSAEDAEADKTLAEARSLLKPQSAAWELELAKRVMATMAPA